MGLEIPNPRFSWELESDRRNVFQSAWEVRCAGLPVQLKDRSLLFWDSGKVESDESVQIEYQGKKLASGQRIWWQVRVWSNKNEESEWSEPAFWEMGLLKKSEWKASWIEPADEEDVSDSGPATYFRREFPVVKTVRKVTAYITGLGLYELSLNGQRIGNDLFTPGWTSYSKRLQYQVYDVTACIQQGGNAAGVLLGDGWYRGFLGWQGSRNFYGSRLAVLCQLKLEYADGSAEFILSDHNWKSSPGPVLKSDIYNGEVYDARLEIPGWNCSGYDDSSWHGVVIKDHGVENLVSTEGVPVRITQTLRPVGKITTPKGELVFDLGQNMVGWVRFRLKGKPGDRIILNHAEVLDQEGNFYTDNLRSARAEDCYIFRGEGTEIFEPHFTFHGFRYVKVSDYPGEVTLDDLEGRVIHSDMRQTGLFECSDEMINRLQQNIDWGLRGNFLDVPTDCPQRDERLGWTGDAQIFAPTACFNREAVSFYSKWMKDFISDQKADGSIPWVVPNVLKDGGGTGWSDGYGAIGWADAAVIVPWTVYQVYGNKRILEDQYESMQGWVEYMIRESGGNRIVNKGFHFGDWLSFAEYYSYNYNAPDYGYAGAHTDKELIATAYFYHTTGLMQKIAAVLGKPAEAERYASILPEIRAAFQKEFLTPTGRLTSHTQTAYILALTFGLLPENTIAVAAKRLADDVRYFGHLTTGFLGTPLICQALTDHGYSEVAFNLLFNKRYPSWLYPVTRGATTIWERWDGIRPDGTFQTAGMNSFNHYAYGAVGDWLYSRVAGMRSHSEVPGYKRIVIEPHLTDQLSYVKAKYHSVYGPILVFWAKQADEFNFSIEIPVNTKALIYLPCPDIANVREGGLPLEVSPEISCLGIEEERIVLEVGSGQYLFTFSGKRESLTK